MSIKSNAWQSKREQEVIELITQGLHYKGVAVRLSIHPGRCTRTSEILMQNQTYTVKKLQSWSCVECKIKFFIFAIQ